jgi:hypothetical protein
MRSITDRIKSMPTFGKREIDLVPMMASGAYWIMVVLLVLMVFLAALLLNGFFSSLATGHG